MFRKLQSAITGVKQAPSTAITHDPRTPPDGLGAGVTDELIAKVCTELDRRRVPYLLNDVTNFVAQWHSTCPSPELLAQRFESMQPAANTTVQDCPKCGLINSPNAMRCDCGWDFVARRQERSYLEPTRGAAATAGMGVAGVVLAILLIRLVIGLLTSFAKGG